MRDAIAYTLVSGGFVLMVIGIWEVGGLFNLAVGFVTFWLGATAILVEDGRRYRHEIEEFRRVVHGL